MNETTVTIERVDEHQIVTESNLQRRSIKHAAIIEDRGDYKVRLAMNIHHNNGGRYLVSVWRERVSDGIITVSIMEDSARREYVTQGARYSAKNLEAIAAEQKVQFARDVEELADWAREIKTH